MPHLDPLPWDASPQFRERFEHYQSTRGFVPNSILTMQRRPAIAQAFMDLNKAVLYEGTVAEELKMLVSLVTSQASGCRYCQAHMTNLASIYRASDEKIRAVWEFETSPLFAPAERAALRLGYRRACSQRSHRRRLRRAEEALRRRADGRDRGPHRALRLPQSMERHHGNGAGAARHRSREPRDCRHGLAGRQARAVTTPFNRAGRNPRLS